MTDLITGFLSVFSSVFSTYIPAIAKGLADMFQNLFCISDATTHAVTGLNALGTVAVILIAMGVVAGLVATALRVLRVRKAGGKKKKSKR